MSCVGASASSKSVPAKHDPGRMSAEDGARADVEARESAAQIPIVLAHEPVSAMRGQRGVGGEDVGASPRSRDQCRRGSLVRGGDRVVRARAPSRAATTTRRRPRSLHRRRRALRGRAHGVVAARSARSKRTSDVLVVVARVVDRARERPSRPRRVPLRAVGQRGELLRALATVAANTGASHVRSISRTPARVLRARPRSACRTRRRVAAHAALSVTRVRPPVPAARRAVAPRAGSPPSCGRRPPDPSQASASS